MTIKRSNQKSIPSFEQSISSQVKLRPQHHTHTHARIACIHTYILRLAANPITAPNRFTFAAHLCGERIIGQFVSERLNSVG